MLVFTRRLSRAAVINVFNINFKGREYIIEPVSAASYVQAYQHYGLALALTGSTVPNVGLPNVLGHIQQAFLWLGVPAEIVEVIRVEQINQWLAFTINEEEQILVSGELWLINGCWQHNQQVRLEEGKELLKRKYRPKTKKAKKQRLSERLLYKLNSLAAGS